MNRDVEEKTGQIAPGRSLRLWTRWQMSFVAVQAAFLLIVCIITMIVNPDYLGLLVRHPIGIKMLITALGLTVTNFGLFLAMCAVLNRYAPPTTFVQLLIGLLGGVFMVLFLLPVLFIVLVGPAATSIMEGLSHEE
ncbi:MAG: hypothetical protein JNM56_15500 [Planctomycetia bacterium]|nr:hypothetical protein [Planctomycetia bacterium]